MFALRRCEMNRQTLETLELDALIDMLAGQVQSPLGRGLAESLSPMRDLNEINRALDCTTECVDYLATGGGFGLSGLSDPAEALGQLAVEGTSLSANQILAVERIIAVAMDLRGQFSDPESRSRYPNLWAITSSIPDIRRVLASFRGKILPTGEIDDNASTELRRIRREINDRRGRIYRSLESLMRDQAGSIQEELVTIRNSRFVIPVRTDSRGQVQGVVHGLSSSGQTTFVEPLPVINQNNELVRLHELEEIEIAQILLSITESLRINLPAIRFGVDAIARIDFIGAKARLSRQFKCVRPVITAERKLSLTDARHILLERTLSESGGRIVPISLGADSINNAVVISGPNAGGKTVVLKTAGLCCLMAQMGLHLPAAAAELPVFDQVFADIGDHQSIAANLSTFTGHMQNVAETARLVTASSLVLLDEVGTGTDPDEGAALAVAIVDHFKRSGAMIIATTHYNALKVWVSQTEGALNASVEFDEQTLRPTYRLILGVAGASSGLQIARRMAVPESVVDEAAGILDPINIQAGEYLRKLKSLVDEQQSLLTALEEERTATAQKFAKLDIEFQTKEYERRREFERELARVIDEFSIESQRIIATLDDKAIAARLKKEADARAGELRRSAAVRLRKQTPSVVETTEPAAAVKSDLILGAGAIGAGDRVAIRSLGREGVVESVSENTYTVTVGSLRFRTEKDDLALVKTAPPPAARRKHELPQGVTAMVTVDEDFSGELNIIGMRSDEAADSVDKFLDRASLAGAESIRIIHGYGKGALRRAVAEVLTGHPHVARFEAAPPNQGGAGATIVQLRQ